MNVERSRHAILQLRTVLLALALALALAAYGAYVPTRADAAVTPGSTSGTTAAADELPEITPAQIAAAVAEIKRSGRPYDTFAENGQRYISVKFGTGSAINLPDTTPLTAGGRVTTPPNGSVSPQIGIGGGLTTPYVTFNQREQNILLKVGAGAFLPTICAIGGTALCTLAGAALTVVINLIGNRGICQAPTPTLRAYFFPFQYYKDGCYR